MKLRDLQATFLRLERRLEDVEVIVGDHETWRERGCPTQVVRREVDHAHYVTSLEEADGVQFLCPLCFQTNGGARGTHVVTCWFNKPTVPLDATPRPGRWNPSGTGLDDLTFVPPGAVSVQVLGGCNWHGYVRDGEAS